MEKLSTKDRLRELADKLGITQSDMCEKTGIPKSSMSLYWSGKRIPKQNILSLIANKYNIQEAWLMGYDVPMEDENKKAESYGSLVAGIIRDEDMMQILEYSQKLQPAQRKQVADYIKFLLQNNEE